MATTQVIDHGGKISAFVRVLGVLPVLITVDDTYSSGVTVDLTTPLADGKVNFADVLDHFMGYSEAGYMAHFTKSATSGQFTVKLWNGTTEHSGAACSQVIHVLVPSC